MRRYEAAVALAEASDAVVHAEALRRLAVLRHRSNDTAGARELCLRSRAVAERIGHTVLVAEALNTLGGLELNTGSLDQARRLFLEALELGGNQQELRARAEQNLGILANIRGELDVALDRYQGSLDAYRDAGDEHGCAIAYCNLGIVSADLERYDEADWYFTEGRTLAEASGDQHLEGLCLVNHALVDVARQRFEDARQHAEAALALFDRCDAEGSKATAYRVIGMVFRETGRLALAESRLCAAMEGATRAGSVLGEADAARELALLYQAMGRNQQALGMLNTAHRLFRRLDARVDLINVGGKAAELEVLYLAVVRRWGQALEASDRRTFGHCERVAQHAVAMARVLGFGDTDERALLLGAYLHDVGMVRVPHEILSKAGPLTRAERRLVRMHPVWGMELLKDVEFPWELKPIIRWHHERWDGKGYPDRLAGDAIPVAAQIVGVLDAYDTLASSRVHPPAMASERALAEISRRRHWWTPRVFEAFLEVVTRPAGESAPVGRQFR